MIAQKLLTWFRERGLAWTLLYVLREVVLRASAMLGYWLESALMGIERRRMIFGPSTLSMETNTRADNERIWSAHDWSRMGEEWTDDVRHNLGKDPEVWKRDLIESVLLRDLKPGSEIVEIGPGGGRWSEILLQSARRLHLVDITQRCLDLCRERFSNDQRIVCHLVTEKPWLNGIDDGSVDFIWSYDAFVHINPLDTKTYIEELQRVLKPGGVAVVHHPGDYASHRDRQRGFRSNVDSKMFRRLVESNGLTVVSQDFESPHLKGDCITTFTRTT